MDVVVVTGSGGLIGSEAAEFYCKQGFLVVGIDNDLRSTFFGAEASTAHTSQRLTSTYDNFEHVNIDIRDQAGIDVLFEKHARSLAAVIHTAAQPSHDWAASDPFTDFTVNANGTLNLLQAARTHCPDTPFIFTSTNKVYGDRPNFLPLQELETRLELPASHRWHQGIDLEMPIDNCTHSLFGVSKASADLLVQEYGRYFDMPTVCFRGGCLTGPQHAGAQLHGFLAYLMRCAATNQPYTIFGYGGKQVRDNIHACDVISAFEQFRKAPRAAAVYNLGGGRKSNVSMLEAIKICEEITGNKLAYTLSDEARIGDHRWWISDTSAFKSDYPEWDVTVGIKEVLQQIYTYNIDRWTHA